MPSSSRVIRPERPNKMTTASAMTKGGEMIGRSATPCTKVFAGMVVRVAEKASTKPAAVAITAEVRPSSSVLNSDCQTKRWDSVSTRTAMSKPRSVTTACFITVKIGSAAKTRTESVTRAKMPNSQGSTMILRRKAGIAPALPGGDV